jgi:hypothetical protein
MGKEVMQLSPFFFHQDRHHTRANQRGTERSGETSRPSYLRVGKKERVLQAGGAASTDPMSNARRPGFELDAVLLVKKKHPELKNSVGH